MRDLVRDCEALSCQRVARIDKMLYPLEPPLRGSLKIFPEIDSDREFVSHTFMPSSAAMATTSTGA